MENFERREKIIKLLQNSNSPISGTELAKQLGVSRQVIVQDIALLRAVNKNILSTTKGYLLYYPEKQKVNRCFQVKHTTEQIKDELSTIVEHGGKILDVIIEHEIYGTITVDLVITNKQEVFDFVKKVTKGQTLPLKELTADVHLHTIEAETVDTLDEIEQALRSKGYLIDLK